MLFVSFQTPVELTNTISCSIIVSCFKMTYIKFVLLFILMMLDRCGTIPSSMRGTLRVEKYKETPAIKGMEGTWRLSLSSTDRQQQDAVNQENETNNDLLLSFFPDSTFTEIGQNGEYESGKWSYTESLNSLSVIYQDRTEKYKVSFSREDNGLRIINLISGDGKTRSLAGFGKRMEKFREDPFYQDNNLWRIKPTQPETDQQINVRLSRFILHSAYIFNAADVRKQQLISWEFSKGILKIYNAGIGVLPKNQIPQSWINSFHSKEDASKAREMLENYLFKSRYKGSATGNWLRDDYNILISIYNGLQKPV